jgi:uncharacterized protein
MNTIDPLNHSLYFSAAATAAQQAAAEAKKKEKTDTSKRQAFKNMLKATAETEELEAAGLPIEIAGLSEDEAIVFLKDAVDVSGDKLAEKMTSETFAQYRNSISQFIRYVIQNGYNIEKHRRPGLNRKGKPRDPAIQIKIIDQKLDGLAADLLYNHKDKLKLLAKVDELNGLLIDLLAA